jgi:hypothetical protein
MELTFLVLELTLFYKLLFFIGWLSKGFLEKPYCVDGPQKWKKTKPT